MIAGERPSPDEHSACSLLSLLMGHVGALGSAAEGTAAIAVFAPRNELNCSYGGP